MDLEKACKDIGVTCLLNSSVVRPRRRNCLGHGEVKSRSARAIIKGIKGCCAERIQAQYSPEVRPQAR
jgi:hypothetical protein